ncbi:MAG: exodeoxyribonuclease V subunit alpha [Caldimonas sp.]
MRAKTQPFVDPAQAALFPATEGLDATALLGTLGDWAERGWIRRLDAALARFLAETCTGMTAPALFAAALTAHMEGRGHACVSIDEMVSAPAELLGWKPEPLAALAAVMATLPRDAAQWIDALGSCGAVCADEPPSADARPLVLRQGRLYLRRYWTYECRVARQVRQRAAFALPVDEPTARLWLDRLFPEPAPGRGPDWQKIACAVALRGCFSIMTGGPGTGKTYTAARLLALLFAMAPDRERLRVALAAPTGKAAARLKQSIDAALVGLQDGLGETLPLGDFAASLATARTLHSLLGARSETRRFRHDAAHPLDVDVLIIDEASMVHLEMMDALLAAMPAGARIVLLGDKDQLASVEAGAVLGELCGDAEAVRYTPETARYIAAVTGQVVPEFHLDTAGPALAQRTVMLRDSQRFGGDIGRLAAAVHAGDAVAAQDLLPQGGSGPVCWMPAASPAAIVELAAAGRAGAPGGYRAYLEAIARRPAATDVGSTDAWAREVLSELDRFRILCAVREGEWGVGGLNEAIEKRLRDDGLLSGAGAWYAGRPVIVTRNDRAVGVYNGDIGIALAPTPDSKTLRAWFVQGNAVRSVAVGRLVDVETAFAMTVHKAQGSEFAHTVLVLPPEPGGVTSRELIYTGMTRAQSALTVVSKSESTLADGIAKSARRSSGLRSLLQEKSS